MQLAILVQSAMSNEYKLEDIETIMAIGYKEVITKHIILLHAADLSLKWFSSGSLERG